MSTGEHIDTILDATEQPLLSFEFFPPRDDAGMASLKKAASELKCLHPDFVTVTYGAGGSTRERTLDVCILLKNMGYQRIMPHLTCVGTTRDELADITDQFYNEGFRNIMALRGDPPEGQATFTATEGGFAYAADLVRFLKERYNDICCGVAGYPEKHPEADTMDSDIAHLKEKVDAGASFVTTQLFFDDALYLDFVKRCRDAGIQCPILPGLLPVISLKQALRMTERCKASLPDTLVQQLESSHGIKEQMEAIGIQWAVDQIKALLEGGAPGIHLYVIKSFSMSHCIQILWSAFNIIGRLKGENNELVRRQKSANL